MLLLAMPLPGTDTSPFAGLVLTMLQLSMTMLTVLVLTVQHTLMQRQLATGTTLLPPGTLSAPALETVLAKP